MYQIRGVGGGNRPLPPSSDGPFLKRSIVEEEGVSCVQQPRIGVVGIKISIAQSTRTICLRQDFNPGVANLNSKSKLSLVLSQIIVNCKPISSYQQKITCAFKILQSEIKFWDFFQVQLNKYKTAPYFFFLLNQNFACI